MNHKVKNSKNFIKVFGSSKLVIYAENPSVPSYYPNDENDIQRLCKDTGIQTFIPERNPKYPQLFIFKNKNYNMGVVTNVAIKKNQIICEYLGELASLNKETTPARVKKHLIKQLGLRKNYSAKKLNVLVDAEIRRITHYAFEISARAKINDSILAHNKRSIAGFINHNGTDPNVVSDIKNKTIYYKAARNIYKGEQLVIDYGLDYDYPDNLRYIPSTESHLSPGSFLACHINDYYKKPMRLTHQQKNILQTFHDFLMVPYIFYQYNPLIKQKKLNDKDQYAMRLPFYTFSTFLKNNSHYQVFIPEQQHNFTAIMFACVMKNAELIKDLVTYYKLDIFAKTGDDLDAMIVAIKISASENEFLQLAKPIIKKAVKNLDRIHSLGSDNHAKTALHLLIEREWCNAIRLFDNAIFFDVVDGDGYDPLMFAIAHTKTKALACLLTLKCVKKSLYELLFAEDETKKDYVLKRAIKKLSHQQLQEIHSILLKAVAKKPAIKKKLKKFFNP